MTEEEWHQLADEEAEASRMTPEFLDPTLNEYNGEKPHESDPT